MDNLTHSLFALTIANAGLRRAGRGSTAALVIASNIPDIEVFTAATSGRLGYLAAHRGPTHGPLGLALGAVCGLAVWLALRLSRNRRGSAGLGALVVVSCLGVAGHVAMDFATSYGTRVLSPFRQTWYGTDLLPIVDPVLWAILAGGIVASAIRPERRARFAAAALLLAAGDYALRGVEHARAVDAAVSIQASRLARPVAAPGAVFRYLDGAGSSALPAALPTVWSPFEWRLIVRTTSGFEVRTLNLLNGRDTGDVLQFPDDRGELVDRAGRTGTARVFLAFSRFPAVDAIARHDGGTMVHWYDLRFAEHPLGPGDGRRYTSPFAVWVRFDADGRIVGEGLGPG